jgi:hypothetical protein
MLCHATTTAAHHPTTQFGSTTPPFRRTSPPGTRSRDATADHVYARPVVHELRRPLNATFDPHTW